LKSALPEAVETLVNLLHHKDGRIRFLAAKELIDRNLGRTAQVVAALNNEGESRIVLSWLGEDDPIATTSQKHQIDQGSDRH
jgi:hypothetical protein